nr:AAA family ATPase [Rhizobium sp. FY34]
MSGPPGTGKTLFAEALARTCRIPIVVTSAAQWQACGYLNDMLKAMRDSFAEARSKGAALLFIDEIDAVGSRATNRSSNADYTRQVINGLLELLDGFERRRGIVVVGATNHPEYIDPAILRPGRLDKHFIIPLPDTATRRQIFQFHAGFPVPEDREDGFARSTLGMAGADLEQLVRDGRRTARRQGQPFEFGHVASIANPLIDLPADQMRRTAFHEAGHAIVGLELGMELEGITINDKVLATGIDNLGGAVFRTPTFPMKTRSYFLDQICMYLAGLGAESLIFGEFTETGGDPRSDLARATAMATKVEACYGMGATLAIDLVEERDLALLRAGDFRLRKAVTELLDAESVRAKTILDMKIDAFCAVAETLLRKRNMSVVEVQDVVRAYPPREGAFGGGADRSDQAIRTARRETEGLHLDDIRREVDAALRRWGII